MQKWTTALSRAVNTGVSRLVPPKGSQITGIPRDPLKLERLEIEGLLNLLSALYENQRWLLVTLLNFSCQHEYVAKLVDATAHRSDLSGHSGWESLIALTGSGVNAFQEATLKIHAECEAYTNEIRDNLDLTHRTMEDLTSCLKRFELRLKTFQTAVEYRMKVKRAEAENVEGGASTAPAVQKRLERWQKKCEDAKNDFRQQHTQLETDVKGLLQRARGVQSEVFAAALRCQRVVAERLHRSYAALEWSEDALRRSDASISHGLALEQMTSEGGERSGSRVGSGELDAPQLPTTARSATSNAAQLFLLTHRTEAEPPIDIRRSVPVISPPSQESFSMELSVDEHDMATSATLSSSESVGGGGADDEDLIPSSGAIPELEVAKTTVKVPGLVMSPSKKLSPSASAFGSTISDDCKAVNALQRFCSVDMDSARQTPRTRSIIQTRFIESNPPISTPRLRLLSAPPSPTLLRTFPVP